MPSSILNSDDGVISGTSGLKSSGGDDAVLLIQTKGVTAQTVDAGQRTKFPTTIGVGGATPSTSGSGITFPASQSASTDANTLDDYEEGTWTPADGSGASLSFSSVEGFYIKIGRQVFLTADFTYPSTASGSDAEIGGLPFTIVNKGGGYSQFTTATAGAIAFRNSGGGADLLVTNGTNTDSALSNANLSGARIQLFFLGSV